ncbi:hypothetical protein ACFQ07_29850 [Actinomadura adrarensis]|uniref:SMI1/KNR4 family protein n=1 Tax=Actinomadura adrarensis TaxID=1819600 RepID=A0ABW3CQF9_9ACTN
MNRYQADVPDGLSRRARSFVRVHGLRVGSLAVEDYRSEWLERGIPSAEIDRVAAFGERWGGLALPPSPRYNGGPRFFTPDTPETDPSGGWWFEAGEQRASVPYGFMIGPDGEFGVHADRWVPLHATVEGWVESLSLTYHARLWAKSITKLVHDEVETIDLTGYVEVPEVVGLADSWWRGPDSLVAIYRGEAECLAFPAARTAYIYSGLDDWGLHG